MHETYEERRFCCGPSEWRAQVERLRAAAGAAFFGVFRGQIGLEANEGVLLTAYADVAKLKLAVGALRAASADARDVRTERMIATVRPASPAPPTRSGVYAFRTFDVRDADSAEFVSLSERAWPEFEASYDVEIIRPTRASTCSPATRASRPGKRRAPTSAGRSSRAGTR